MQHEWCFLDCLTSAFLSATTFSSRTEAKTRSHFGFDFYFARFDFFKRVQSSCAMTFESHDAVSFHANSECLDIPVSHDRLDVEAESVSDKCLSRHWCSDFNCDCSDLFTSKSCRRDICADCDVLTNESAYSCRATNHHEETFDCGSVISNFDVFADLSEFRLSTA